jgi:starvation-inducible outer membrane lipoprotein
MSADSFNSTARHRLAMGDRVHMQPSVTTGRNKNVPELRGTKRQHGGHVLMTVKNPRRTAVRVVGVQVAPMSRPPTGRPRSGGR